MTETLTPVAAVPATFAGRRLARTATALASSGLLVGIGAATAAPALAAEATDCVDANTVDSTDSGTVADIQTLLDADTAIVCLEGSFTLAGSLTFDHNLELFGLAGAELDGDSVTRMLTGSGGANLMVQNISFVNGQAFEGGAIWANGELIVENSTFTNNNSVEDGGAIYLDGSNTIEVLGSTFTGNATGPEVGGEGYSGGAIFAQGNSTVFVEESTFTDNEASGLGGAIAGYFIINELSEFTNNTAQFGGAQYGFATIGFESTYAGNSAEEGGAVRAFLYGIAVGSTFVDNTATAYGGAIASGLPGETSGYGAVVSLNSTFVDNTAVEVGGAVVAAYGEIALSTFLGNEADADLIIERSDAIYMFGDEESMELAGNIFAGSRPNAQLGASFDNTYDDLGGNVFSTTESAESALGTPHETTLFSQSVTSIFGAGAGLADNGGPTQTVALVDGSPAIDVVPPFALDFFMTALPADSAFAPVRESLVGLSGLVAVSDSPDVDQRSVERTEIADAGAYEYGEAELAATGADTDAAGWLAGLAAMLLGMGAVVALGARRLARTTR